MSRLYFSVPLSLAKQVASMAKAEGRTMNELFIEMMRVYRVERESAAQAKEFTVKPGADRAGSTQAQGRTPQEPMAGPTRT